ncbi:MAG: carbon-nitrogen hydrolase family protein, partial [Candidatus Kapaibacterium sp.]
MKIACAQFAPIYRDTKRNLERISNFVHAADADLVIFPELALTGYFFTSQEEITSIAEAGGGSIARYIGEIAKRENKAIILGFLEEADGKFYNAALAFDNNGN